MSAPRRPWPRLAARALAPVLGVTLAACGSDTATPGADGRLGVAGASCVRTADCEPPLQCFGQVCILPGGDAGSNVFLPDGALPFADDASETGDGATVGEAPDLGPMPDVPGTTPDAVWQTIQDVIAPDAAPYDVGGWTDAGALPDGQSSPFSNCGAIGIAPQWSGVFSGLVAYDTPFPIPGADSSGTLPVAGTMSFEMSCIQQKLVVQGDMTGLALDEYPFELTLGGSFNPDTGKLAATILDGGVNLLDVVTVHFAGKLNGTLQSASLMVGGWDGYSTGTTPAGIPGTATGSGTWTANPQ